MIYLPDVIIFSYSSLKNCSFYNIDTVTVKLSSFNLYNHTLSSLWSNFTSKLMVNGVKLTTYSINNLHFKDSLCNGIFIDDKVILFNVHVWEFVGRFNNINSFSFIYNHSFHLFLAVLSMAFLSQRIGAIFFLFIHKAYLFIRQVTICSDII